MQSASDTLYVVNRVESPPQTTSPQSLVTSELDVSLPSFTLLQSLCTPAALSPHTLPEPFATEVRTNGAANGELDRLPCTLDQYLELSNFTSAKYELLDDHLFFKREVDYPESGLIRESLAYKLRQLYAQGRADICIYEVGNVHLPGSSSSPPPPSPTLSYRSSSGLMPDISIMPFTPRTSPQCRSPRSPAFIASYTKNSPLMHIEITSGPSSRRTDFTTKRAKYAEAGVEEYVIIDRDKPHAPRSGSGASPTWRPCVVVGKLHGPGPFRTSGYPTASDRAPPRRSARIAQQSAGYHWEMFEGDDLIDCSFFTQLELTPNSLFQLRKVEQLQAHQEQQFTNRIVRVEARAQRSEQRARRNSEDKRAAEQRARRNSEEKRAAEQRARRNSEERKIAENRAAALEIELRMLKEQLVEEQKLNRSHGETKRSKPSRSSDVSNGKSESDRSERSEPERGKAGQKRIRHRYKGNH